MKPYRLLALLAATALLIARLDAAEVTHSFNIPPQSMAAALERIAKDNDLQVLYFADIARKVRTRGVSGELTLDRALTQLLSGTGVGYRFINERTLTIFPINGSEGSPPTQRSARRDAQASGTQLNTERSVGAGKLEEVIVTAQRVAENLQVTPVSVTALTAASLENLDIQAVGEAARSTPNLEFDQNDSASLVFVRGVGQVDFILTSDPGVAIYVDGVYLPRTFGVLTDLIGVERVEVLRGPQGTLFGKNAIGGAINLVTAEPDDVFRWVLDGRVGSRNRRDASALMNIPSSDGRWAATVAASLRQQDGYIHLPLLGSEAGDINRQTLRTKLRWQIAENLKSTLALEYYRQREMGMAPQAADINPAGRTVALWNTYVGEPIGLLYDRRWLAPRYTSFGTAPQFDNLDTRGATLTLDWNAADKQLKSITAFRRVVNEQSNDPDSSPAPIAQNLYTQRSRMFSQELQFSHWPIQGRLGNVFGVFFLHEFADDAQLLSIAQGLHSALIAAGELELAIDTDVSQRSARTQTTQSYALYDQLTYYFTPLLAGEIGLRYTYEHKDDHLYVFYLNRDLVGVDRQVAQSWTAATPKLSLQYQLTPSHFAYLSVAEGFKSGGINGRPTTDAAILTYGPEKLWNYEIGMKTQWLDDRLRINLAAFHMDYRDIQLQALQIAPGGAPLITTVNGADGRMNGIEAEVSFKPHQRLTLSTSAGYNDFHYTRVDPSTGISPNNTLPYTPRSTYSIAAQLDLPLSKDHGQLTLGTSYNYRTKIYLDTGNIEAVAQPGYGLLNARLNWQAPDTHWNVYLYGKNLTNVYYRVYSVPELFSGLAPTAYGAPREMGLGVKTTF